MTLAKFRGYVGYTPAEFRRKEYYQRQHLFRRKSLRSENKRLRVTVRHFAVARVNSVESTGLGTWRALATVDNPMFNYRRQLLRIHSVRNNTTYRVRNLVSQLSRSGDRISLYWRKEGVERLTPTGFKSFHHPRYAAKALDPSDDSLYICYPSRYKYYEGAWTDGGHWVGPKMRLSRTARRSDNTKRPS